MKRFSANLGKRHTLLAGVVPTAFPADRDWVLRRQATRGVVQNRTTKDTNCRSSSLLMSLLIFPASAFPAIENDLRGTRPVKRPRRLQHQLNHAKTSIVRGSERNGVLYACMVILKQVRSTKSRHKVPHIDCFTSSSLRWPCLVGQWSWCVDHARGAEGSDGYPCVRGSSLGAQCRHGEQSRRCSK